MTYKLHQLKYGWLGFADTIQKYTYEKVAITNYSGFFLKWVGKGIDRQNFMDQETKI